MPQHLVQPTEAEIKSRQKLQEAKSAQALMLSRLCMATAGMVAVGVFSLVAACTARTWFDTVSIVASAGEFFRIGREQLRVYSQRVDYLVEQAENELANLA
mgnify:CR=1 FL=1